MVKCSLFREKTFSVSFRDAKITPIKIFLPGKVFVSTGHNALIQKVKCSLFREKSFPVSFHVARITQYFGQEKLCF